MEHLPMPPEEEFLFKLLDIANPTDEELEHIEHVDEVPDGYISASKIREIVARLSEELNDSTD